MSFEASDTDIFGGALPEDRPELQFLCRAAELSGEGESQWLLGPLPGHYGPFYAIRNVVSVDDDTAEMTIHGTRLEAAGDSLLQALEQLNPNWRLLTPTYVAPYLRAEWPEPKPKMLLHDDERGLVVHGGLPSMLMVA